MLYHRKHVFRDLRSYVCTFPNCQTPEKEHITRHQWMQHEYQMHRRLFICGDCGTKNKTKQEKLAHLESEHGGSYSPGQIPIILEMSDQPVDDTDTQICVSCSREMSALRLQEHLADHLENIALFVLPRNLSDDEEEISNKVLIAESGSSLSSVKSNISKSSNMSRQAQKTPSPSGIIIDKETFASTTRIEGGIGNMDKALPLDNSTEGAETLPKALHLTIPSFMCRSSFAFVVYV